MSQGMRTLVVGSGPIGSYLAAALARAGADVTLHSLGPAFRQMAAAGQLRMAVAGDGAEPATVALRCSLAPPPPGGWELLVLAVKAQDLGQAAQMFKAHARDAVTLLPQNGLPWWQFLGTGGPALRLRSVDPDGLAEDALPLDRIAGCVVTKGLSFRDAATLVETRAASDLFTVGDVVPGTGAAVVPAQLLGQAGLPMKMSDDIRAEKWRKLLVNVAFNPLGAISHLGFGEVLDEPEGERLARQLMQEAVAVARGLGVAAAIDTEAALARARDSRSHKTSMLQDVEAGRRLEIGPIVGVLRELAGHVGLAVPALDVVHACLRLIDHSLGKGPIRQLGVSP